MTDGYHLVAHVVDATSLESAQVEFEIASMSIDGAWYTNDGRQIWPFWTQDITMSTPAIPDGWIEHLHAEAARFATQHAAPTLSLADRLGITKRPPAGPFPRRI